MRGTISKKRKWLISRCIAFCLTLLVYIFLPGAALSQVYVYQTYPATQESLQDYQLVYFTSDYSFQFGPCLEPVSGVIRPTFNGENGQEVYFHYLDYPAASSINYILLRENQNILDFGLSVCTHNTGCVPLSYSCQSYLVKTVDLATHQNVPSNPPYMDNQGSYVCTDGMTMSTNCAEIYFTQNYSYVVTPKRPNTFNLKDSLNN